MRIKRKEVRGIDLREGLQELDDTNCLVITDDIEDKQLVFKNYEHADFIVINEGGPFIILKKDIVSVLEDDVIEKIELVNREELTLEVDDTNGRQGNAL